MTLTLSERETLAEARRIQARARKAARQARPARVQPVAAGQRQPRVREPAFLAFLRRQPCCVGPLGCSGAVEAAHVRFGRPGEGNAGMQRKPSDRNAVPLCRGHHRDGPDAQHRTNERTWWAACGIDPHAYADVLHHQFEEGQS